MSVRAWDGTPDGRDDYLSSLDNHDGPIDPDARAHDAIVQLESLNELVESNEGERIETIIKMLDHVVELEESNAALLSKVEDLETEVATIRLGTNPVMLIAVSAWVGSLISVITFLIMRAFN